MPTHKLGFECPIPVMRLTPHALHKLLELNVQPSVKAMHLLVDLSVRVRSLHLLLKPARPCARLAQSAG